jgi:hypothetical protein
VTVYYFVLALLPLSILSSLVRSRESGTLILAITAFTTFCISGLRWASDVDHLDYADMFTENPYLSNFNRESIRDLHGEPGYLLISAVLKTLGMDFVVLSTVCAAFSVSAKVLVVKRFTNNASLVFCLYLCIHFVTIEFIQIRWAVASALIAIAVYQQCQRRLLATAALLALAISFHYFAALFVLVCLMAEIRKESLFYALAIVLSLIGVALAIEGLVPEAIDSDIYVVKRTLRYLTDPLSNVGFFSYAKLAMFPVITSILTKCYPDVVKDSVTGILYRITYASIAVTLLLSFVPLMHFRAVVLADLFGLLLIMRILDFKIHRILQASIIMAFGILYAVWYVFDVINYIDADRLYNYQSWLKFII